MKKFAALLLSLLLVVSFAVPSLAACRERTFGGYQHVIIVGVDGAGTYFEKDYMTNFHRIFADGAVRYGVRTETKTDSGPNWASILSGVSYFKTGAENGVVGGEEDRKFPWFPSIFSDVRKAMPDATLASFCNWSAINIGVVEDGIGVNKQNIPNDDRLTEAVTDYLDAGNRPTLVFIHLGEVDDVGHAYGSGSDKYDAAMQRIDARIGKIYDAAERAGLMENGLFLVTADHGHKATGGHGRFSKIESLSTIAVKGKTVKKGGTLDCDTKLRDVAAISLYALGVLCKPVHFSAKVPANCFNDVLGQIRPVHRDIIDLLCGAFMWIYTNLGAPLDKYFP